MGTILTIHGTFAHLDVPGAPIDSASSTSYWWRPDSPFVKELTTLVQGADGDCEVMPFIWGGENSERARRAAGRRLFLELKRLEEGGEPYAVIAHSHGGSVLSAALLQAAARKQELPGLKRWITVGTPFVELRRERFLFMRLPIILKAMYVASFMLFLIFAGATIGRLWDGDIRFDSSREMWRLGIGAIAASVPVIVFLIVALFRERQQRFFNLPRVRARAQKFFADRWVALTHEDDEAVRGLGSLRSVSLPIFDRQFAVPLLSLMSVFMLPAMYVIAINSPSLMTGLSEMLRTNVYKLDELATQTESYRKATRSFRSIRGDMRDARKVAEDTLQPLDQRQAAKKIIQDSRRSLRVERDRIEQNYPDLPRVQRASRFQRKFLEDGEGNTCNGGQLCGGGDNVALNARLLLHLITDEVSSLFVDDDVQRSRVGRLASYLLPVVLVPIVLGGIAILWVLVVQVFARWFSRLASRWLDTMTWAQIRRAAVGNDTEDEVAVGTTPFPKWTGASRPFLPIGLSAEITQCSNDATFQSLGKFRNALSELVFLEQGNNKNNKEADSLLAYLNWNELIHTSYFCVPAFTQLTARALAGSEGFRATPVLREMREPEQRAWLMEAAVGAARASEDVDEVLAKPSEAA